MKAFFIDINEIIKGPKELKLQLPVQALAIKSIPGKDRPDYILVRLTHSILWIDNENDINHDIDHLVLCTRYKGQQINKDMKETIVAIAYVTDDSILEDNKLSFNKCHYVAMGKASGRAKWSIFR